MNTNLSFLLIPLVLVCFALSPRARAVTPAPDGGYPNGNTAEGAGALFSLTTGLRNTAIGFRALFYNTAGNDNTAVGDRALYNINIRFNGNDENTAVGARALASMKTGFGNTADGADALRNANYIINDTATGYQALFNNHDGQDNTANGAQALFSNYSGIDNTATGSSALFRNGNGFQNTATGKEALYNNDNGISNTATGCQALYHNIGTGGITGSRNTAEGYQSLFNNITGNGNIALGYLAGENLTTGSNNIDIGNPGGATSEANTIRIGTQGTQAKTFIAGISGTAVPSGVPVVVATNGQLGVGAAASSARFKTEIKPMDKASEAILALKPVTFRYKQELDPQGTSQFGLVAEDVEKVNPALITRDADGKPYTVRYEAVNAMLLNEFLKAHRTVQEQQREISALRSELKEQRALIQKVNDKVELNRRAPQMAINNQ